MQILLASASPARKILLEKLGMPFITLQSHIDETPKASETAEQLVQRLAIAKAQSLSPYYDQYWIIGCDQVCVLQGKITGKPHIFARACEQLRHASGNNIVFYCGLALLNPSQNKLLYNYDTVTVRFRSLTEQEIIAYVTKEQPLGCAGSFKYEGSGICLVERLEGNDFNTLVGLPLIMLNRMFLSVGINPLLRATSTQ